MSELAQQFHEAYERLAPQFGYKTREATAVPWSEVPDNNKQLMRAVVAEVIAQERKQILDRVREEVIGEPEGMSYTDYHEKAPGTDHYLASAAYGRNQLRAEQLAALKGIV